MARTTIMAIAVLGLATGLVACSDDEVVQDNRTFAFSDVEDFQPADGRFTYDEPWRAVAGESWAKAWPELGSMDFEPPDCLTFMTMSEGAQASDESETASDELSHIHGDIAGTIPGDDGYGAVSVTIRVFDSPASASRFLSDVRASAIPCADGYSYFSDEYGYGYAADSVSGSEVDFPGVSDVLKIDQRNLVAEFADLPGSMRLFDHYTHYVLARGNVALLLIYGFDGSAVTDDDAADLIGQFIEHLG